MKGFLEALLAPAHQRELLKWIERVAEIALDNSLGNTLDRYQLDPLQSVPIDKIDVADFKTKRWLQTPNPMLGNVSPRDMIRFGRYAKLLRFVTQAMEEGSVSGERPQTTAASV